MRKKILYGLLFLLIATCGWHCKLILYGIEQGRGQWHIVHNAVPIAEIMADTAFPDSLKAKLALVQEIRQFGIDSLGINDSENYQEVYDQKGQPVLWVVTACLPYALEEYTWKFPVVGEVGYKGFFDKADALKEEQRLKEEGYDTDVDAVDAWSTLGWFKDPILSNMLNKPEGELARLILHELTHATLYVKDDAELSENLATFVGDQGAYFCLEQKYGKDSEEYRRYEGGLSDVEKYGTHVLAGCRQLETLYASFADKPGVVKDSLKTALIHRITTSADTISFSNRQRYVRVLKPTFRPNNTFFIHYQMYREQQGELDRQFREEFEADFPRYLAYLKDKYG